MRRRTWEVQSSNKSTGISLPLPTEFPLATSATPAGTPNRLVEVYTHPALMTLIGASYHLPYKVSRSRRYWPGNAPAKRKANLIWT